MTSDNRYPNHTQLEEKIRIDEEVVVVEGIKIIGCIVNYAINKVAMLSNVTNGLIYIGKSTDLILIVCHSL